MRFNKIIILAMFALTISLQGKGQPFHYGQPKQRQIFFEGNSLFNQQINQSGHYGFYIPSSVYNNLRSTYRLAYFSHAIGSETQTLINSKVSTNLSPYVKYGDVVVIWEGTNDMSNNSLSGQAAFDLLVTFVTTVRGYGAEVVVCTVTARDKAGDAADLMTRIGDYNTLVRNNSVTYNYTVCDLAADPLFDARADCSNTTYYDADKIHLATAGQDQVITLLTSTLTTLLASL